MTRKQRQKKMGVDGKMVKGEGVVVNYVLLTEEERDVFDTDMLRILRAQNEGDYYGTYDVSEAETMKDFPSEEARTLVSFDSNMWWRWLTTFWAKPPETLFDWMSLAAPWRRPDVFNTTIPQKCISVPPPCRKGDWSDFHRPSCDPFLVRLDESPSAAAEAAERLTRIAPGIAGILRRGGPGVICGSWISYTTS